MKKYYSLFLFWSLLTGLSTSCSDDNKKDPYLPTPPQVSIGNPSGQTTCLPGETIELKAILNNPLQTTFQWQLNKKTVTVNVGKTVKIKLQNNKKKVKWTVTSGKKNVTLSKKKKTGVTIKGMKAGKAKVQAKVGKKKYVCKVTVKNTKKVNKIANKNNSTKPGNTKAPIVTNSPKPSTDNTKKIVSIAWPSDTKYVFIYKGEKLVDKGNRNLANDEIDVANCSLDQLDVKYADGSEEKDTYFENISYDFSQINFNKVGTYKLMISYGGCSCEVPVVVAEKKEEGLFTYLTDGNVAKLLEMRGDLESDDGDYRHNKYSGTTLSIPETLGGAKVVQGTPEYWFSGDNNIEKIEFPRYYSEGFSYRYSGKYFPKLKEIIINNPDSEYVVKDNVVFAENGEVLCLYPGGLQNASYSIPEGVKEVDGIYDNIYLEELTYPKSFIGYALRRGWPMENPGAGLPNLKTINVASENPYWVSKDGVMYQREEDNKLALATYPRKKTDLSFSVGEDVSWIPSGTGMDRNSFLENIVFKSGKTTIGVEALNGNSIKNVYLDFEDEDTGDTGLYLDGFKFDYYGSEKEHSHNIYMRKGTSLKHIAEELQAKVQYY